MKYPKKANQLEIPDQLGIDGRGTFCFDFTGKM